MRDALAYLIGQSLRNRLARQLSRVRSPRYAIAMLVGLAYFWFAFLHPYSSSTTTGSPGAPVTGGVSTALTSFLGVSLAITMIVWWLRGGVSGALAFQPAEVQMLFPAPLSRRELIGYRVVRSQVLILFNALIWTVLMRRWGLHLAAPLRYATAWAFFSVLSLHRLGAALVQTPPVRGGRRIALTAAKGLAWGAALALAAGVVPVVRRIGELGMEEGVRALGQALTAGPAAVALWPFRLVLAPLTATSMSAWVSSFAVVGLIILLHVAWVLGMKVEFEEAAAVASEQLAKRLAAFRERRAGGSAMSRPRKVKRDWLPLAPVGPAPLAIAWKNTLALVRTGGIRSVIMIGALVVLGTVVSSGLSHQNPGSRILAAGQLPLAVVLAISIFMGPRILRNDLRQDLPSLSLLKTYPLGGMQMLLAQMASPTFVLTLFQAVLIVVGALTLPSNMRAAVGNSRLVIGVVTLPLLLATLNAMNITIQNGGAVLFPGWTRLGPDSGGVEAIGQNLLFTVGSVLVLVLSLILPAIWAGLAFLVTRPFCGTFALAAGAVAFTAAMIAEVGFMVVRLGRTFEKMELSALV
jgi:Putative ABC exporter